MNYRIYVKTPDMNKYGAISGGGIANNLIYAEMWNDLETATKAFDSLIVINPKNYKWQLRDTNHKIIRRQESSKGI